MNIEDLTIKQARELSKLFGGGQSSKSCSLVVGECIFVRTVTHYYTGRVSAVTDSDMVLEDAAWIADTGRFSEALATGALSEVEPYPGRCVVSRDAVIDWSPWDHPLPRVKK